MYSLAVFTEHAVAVKVGLSL